MSQFQRVVREIQYRHSLQEKFISCLMHPAKNANMAVFDVPRRTPRCPLDSVHQIEHGHLSSAYAQSNTFSTITMGPFALKQITATRMQQCLPTMCLKGDKASGPAAQERHLDTHDTVPYSKASAQKQNKNQA